MMCGASPALFGGQAAGGRDPAGVPAHDLEDEHLGRGLAIEATSKPASRVETAMYLATEPKPGQLSVIGRSLSTVFGTWMAWIG